MTSNWETHCYAVDTVCYVSCIPEELNSAITEIKMCLELISGWSWKNGLTLNAAKTKVVCVGSRAGLRRISDNLDAVYLNSERFQKWKQPGCNSQQFSFL